jgi:alkylated DNA repair dioxygenase AlkB
MKKLFKGILKEYHDVITEWDEPNTRIFDGKEVVGRPTRGFGNSNFYYAGKYMRPEPWDSHPLIKEIKEKSEQIVSEEVGKEVEFTFCLCGYYSTEGEGIPHHSDTVPKNSDLVFSISLGGARIMEWRTYLTAIKEGSDTSRLAIWDRPPEIEELYILEHGDALLFDGMSQMFSTHAILPIAEAEERINLTFRTGL